MYSNFLCWKTESKTGYYNILQGVKQDTWPSQLPWRRAYALTHHPDDPTQLKFCDDTKFNIQVIKKVDLESFNYLHPIQEPFET